MNRAGYWIPFQCLPCFSVAGLWTCNTSPVCCNQRTWWEGHCEASGVDNERKQWCKWKGTSAQSPVWMIGGEWQRQFPNCRRFLFPATVLWPTGSLTAAFGPHSCKLPFVLWWTCAVAAGPGCLIQESLLLTVRSIYSVFKGPDLSEGALRRLESACNRRKVSAFRLQWDQWYPRAACNKSTGSVLQ